MGGVLSTILAAVTGCSCRPTPEFEYSHVLDNASIRLLRFHRPKWYTFWLTSPTLCIDTYNIASPPKYVALSYTWGPPHRGALGYGPTDKRPVMIDGRTLFISRNLSEALDALYRAWDFNDDVQHLWADAICINQGNHAERATQVSIMDRIFKGASSTWVWLGKSGPSQAAISLMQRVSKVPGQDLAPYVLERIPPDSFWDARNLPRPTDEAAWAPICQLFENRWFNRTWVIQELVLSNNINILWGTFRMSWNDLGHLALVCFVGRIGQLNLRPGWPQRSPGLHMESDSNTHERAAHNPAKNAFQLWTQRNHYRQWMKEDPDEFVNPMFQEMKLITGSVSGSPISWLMYFCLAHRLAGASDPRDKVFGLQGLVTNLPGNKLKDHLPVTPLYSSNFTHVELYTQVMQRLVEETDDLSMLMAFSDPPSRRDPSLPSWVTDLSQQSGAILMFLIKPRFQANRTQSTQSITTASSSVSQGTAIPGSRSLRIEGMILYARAIPIATIDQLGPSHSDLFERPNWKWASQLLQVAPTYSATGESRVEAFWRTILMNSVAKQYPAEWPLDSQNEIQLHPFRAHVLRNMLMTIRSDTWGTESSTEGDFMSAMSVLDRLSESDFSGCMPTLRTQVELLRQITGKPLRSQEEASAVLHNYTNAAMKLIFERSMEFLTGMEGSMANRRIVFSAEGYIANVPMWTEERDKIFILDSCPCPLVLRPRDDDPDCYTIVGPAYVHGIMYGEAIREDTQWETICIR